MHLDVRMQFCYKESPQLQCVDIYNYNVLTHYNCMYILVLTTLMMVAWVAETCRWFIYSFIHSGVFVGLAFKKCYISLILGIWDIFSLQIFRLNPCTVRVCHLLHKNTCCVTLPYLLTLMYHCVVCGYQNHLIHFSPSLFGHIPS
jgi:hypothetical protein